MKINIKDLKVGQIVFVRKVGSSARYAQDPIVEAVIEKVGVKYLYLKGYISSKFGFEYPESSVVRDISEHSANYEVYLSKQEIIDDIEKYNLKLELKRFFDWSGKASHLTLEQLREIKAITDEAAK